MRLAAAADVVVCLHASGRTGIRPVSEGWRDEQITLDLRQVIVLPDGGNWGGMALTATCDLLLVGCCARTPTSSTQMEDFCCPVFPAWLRGSFLAR